MCLAACPPVPMAARRVRGPTAGVLQGKRHNDGDVKPVASATPRNRGLILAAAGVVRALFCGRLVAARPHGWVRGAVCTARGYMCCFRLTCHLCMGGL